MDKPMKILMLTDYFKPDGLVFYTYVPIDYVGAPPNYNVYWKDNNHQQGSGPFPEMWGAHKHYLHVLQHYEKTRNLPAADVIHVDFIKKERV